MEEIYKNKSSDYKRNHVVPILLLVIGLLLGAIGTYIYFEILNKETTKEEEKEEVKAEEITLETDSYLVTNLLNQYYNSYSTNYMLKYYFYEKDNTIINDLAIEDKQMMIISSGNLYRKSYITKEEFQIANRLLFGPDSEVADQTITPEWEVYIYNTETKVYNFQDPVYGIVSGGAIERKVIEASEIENEKITITVAVGESVPGETGSEKIYSDLEGNELVDFNMDTDYDQLDKFEHVYAYDEEYRNYYLKEVNKIN